MQLDGDSLPREAIEGTASSMASSDSRVGVFFMPKTTSLQPALQDTKHQQVMNALQALRSEVHSLRLEVAELRQQQAEQAVAATRVVQRAVPVVSIPEGADVGTRTKPDALPRALNSS